MSKVYTWGELRSCHCSNRWYRPDPPSSVQQCNPYYEDFALRRFNYAVSLEREACRLVFLRGVLDNPDNKTLVRNGRFIWCRNLKYEGVSENGFRQISFTVDKGQKRFVVEENQTLCLPGKTYVSNNKYFRKSSGTFKAFGGVFGYEKTLKMMAKAEKTTSDHLLRQIEKDNPYRAGTLVAPRLGYFYPMAAMPPGISQPDLHTHHPYGIILGPCLENSREMGRQFYRVRFGGTTYERVHPVEMEIINEV